MSIFDNIRDFINATKIDDFVLRRDLSKIDYEGGMPGFSIDNYRRQLTLTGYLEHTGVPGLYKKIKNIPNSLTTEQLICDAYNNGFPIKNKRIKLKRLKHET